MYLLILGGCSHEEGLWHAKRNIFHGDSLTHWSRASSAMQTRQLSSREVGPRSAHSASEEVRDKTPVSRRGYPLLPGDMVRIFAVALLGLLLAAAAQAQFQFFEQMFGGGQQQQQHHSHNQQNVASDSSWYQRTYDGGTFAVINHFSLGEVNVLADESSINLQPNVPTTYVPELLPASISHITVLARILLWKIRSS
jgi:hypothetical protein